MSRIRLNQEYRNKIANRMRVHLEQEDTVEKQNYDNLKGDQIDINANAWKMAEKIVRRHYTLDDVAKAQYLQDKFENVSTIAKDSCFHFHYLGTKEDRDYDNNPITKEDTQEKRKYDKLKADQVDINDMAWSVAEKIVRRHYTDEDVEKAYYLQNKFENVSTIAKDSCFHFHYLGTKEDRDYDNNPITKEDTIESHFDFRLNGSIDVDNNYSSSRDSAYGYALFRDELKAQENCNPDILIEQEGKDNNPHKTKYCDNNDKYLGNDDSGYGKQWNEKYQLDLIGRDYCRDRSIACNEQEYMMLIQWKQAKGQFVIAHQKWIQSILDQMKEIKVGLKGYRYLDEALELATELGLNISDAEIIRTNSTGLTIYNPKNLADRIKGMKNKRVKTKAEKIAERVLYEQQQNESVN